MTFEAEFNRRVKAVLAEKAKVPVETLTEVEVELYVGGSGGEIETSLDITGYGGGRSLTVEFGSMAELVRALDAVD